MTTLMQRGATWLGDRLKTAAGRSVTLTRGATTSSVIIGWVEIVEYEEIGQDGLTTSVRYDDWTFNADEVLLSAAQIVPRSGDVLTETLNGSTVKYEVLPTQSKSEVEWLDTSGLVLKVHTKRIQ